MIISNATPLIAFSRIGQLALLREVVGQPLIIPAAVAREIAEYREGRPGSIDLSREPWIETRPVVDGSRVDLLLPTLDRGEAEVIALGLEQRARLVLIDELIGRKVAVSVGLSVSGSVGILIQAKRSGKIAALKPYLQQMVHEGIHFSERFVDAVLDQAGE